MIETVRSLAATIASIFKAHEAPSAPIGRVPEGGWPYFDGPLERRPRNRAEVVAMFGDPTRGGLYMRKPDPKWEAANIVECRGEKAFLPVLAPAYFPVHRLIEPYMREAFRRAEIAAPGYIKRKGTWGYNFRRIRHRADGPLSYHSYGIAVDINPDDNGADWGWKGGKPWFPAWMKRWPRGIPREVVEAFESCGFSWGGWWSGPDNMHFEWMGKRDAKV